MKKLAEFFKENKLFSILTIIVIAFFIITIVIYALNTFSFSNQLEDWTFFINVFAPFITFISVVILYLTFREQRKQFEKNYKKDHLLELYELVEECYRCQTSIELIYFTILNTQEIQIGHQSIIDKILYKKIREAILKFKTSFIEFETYEKTIKIVQRINFLAKLSIDNKELIQYLSAMCQIVDNNNEFFFFIQNEEQTLFTDKLLHYQLHHFVVLSSKIKELLIEECSANNKKNTFADKQEVESIMDIII